MMDEYQYKTLELPAKNQGLFGIGGMPNSEGVGFTGRVIDSSGGFAGGSGGTGQPGQQGRQGEIGQQGGFGIPFEEGSIIYKISGEWTSLPPPSDFDGNALLVASPGGWYWGFGTTTQYALPCFWFDQSFNMFAPSGSTCAVRSVYRWQQGPAVPLIPIHTCI
jgi:hypothetical protein